MIDRKEMNEAMLQNWQVILAACQAWNESGSMTAEDLMKDVRDAARDTLSIYTKRVKGHNDQIRD